MGETYDGDNLVLPEHVLMEILVWLPVITQLRFKSVCKFWRDLIQSPFFIDLQTSTPSRFETFILQVFDNSVIAKWFETTTKFITVTSYDEIFDVRNLGSLSSYTDIIGTRSLRMVGSCNGLICLHESKLKDVFLFNPAIRQFRVLPKSITIEKEGIGELEEDFVVFGFDVKTKDYKVVLISFFDIAFLLDNKTECNSRVQIYNLSTDSWRVLSEDINSLHIQFPLNQTLWYNHGVYLNGCYFFVGRIFNERSVYTLDGSITPLYNNSVMVVFDFSKEIFTTMQFPEHDTRHKMVISYWGDKVVLFTSRMPIYPFPDPEYEYHEIWVLNEDASNNNVNKESWTKLHSFEIRYKSLTHLKCLFHDGKFVMISCKTDDRFYSQLEFLNLVTNKVISDIIVGRDVLSSDVYKESLVSVLGGNGTPTASQ